MIRVAFVLALALALATAPSLLPATAAAQAPVAAPAAEGAHDFDFEFGSWKMRLSRRLHPLTGSQTWVEYDGVSVVRPVWNGAANLGEINLDGGKVRETNFDKYRVLRHNELPVLEALPLPSTEPPGGMGEPTTAIVAPAVANAIFAATGKRLRALPFAAAIGIEQRA